MTRSKQATGDQGGAPDRVELFDRLGDEYEQVVYCHDPATSLKAIIAIHSTVLGPALGGTRFYPYQSENAALTDVLRLARGMTYKSALAGLDLGGGKAVIVGDPAVVKTDALLRKYARFIDSLGGRYMTAEDVGTTQGDMDVIAGETRFVTGTSPLLGGSGDPSDATALGVYWSIRATASHLHGTDEVTGLRVVVSGVGKVGSALARLLCRDGAKVTVADVNENAVAGLIRDRTLQIQTVPAESAHTTDCDIFSPCAMGAVLDQRTIPELRCRAIAGAANNQLATKEDAERLADRSIIYVPDFVANAGGVINIADGLGGYDRERAMAAVERIAATTAEILGRAERDRITTVAAAESLANARIRAADHAAR
jgi:leucine dehydrogenase